MALKLHRRCVSCQCVALRDNFWRVVRVPIALHANQSANQSANQQKSNSQQFQVSLDEGMGRSAYLCKKLECLQIAQKKNRLGRSLRTHIPNEIFDILKSRL
ncbi:YlxR family protein [Pseudanabaena sp. FACHB-1998]|uniref:YlxR family protein n=1 Tax=Pseudanabaena sp. FACHB-1998 TaxID=2692858 RepID=UPI001681432A|nr:YlxR family protein [Pseudanabaena sp. FACHB-1998]MBD2176909.1 YlxR family protein [Pseudanabaena sp. FACHB-1998]